MPDLRVPKRLRTDNLNARKSRVQEDKAAKRYGGAVVPGSGNGRVKGDVRIKDLARLEAKTTKRMSFSVTADLIQKLEDAAPLGSTEVPFLEVTIGDEGPNPKTVHVFPAWVAQELLEALALFREAKP